MNYTTRDNQIFSKRTNNLASINLVANNIFIGYTLKNDNIVRLVELNRKFMAVYDRDLNRIVKLYKDFNKLYKNNAVIYCVDFTKQ